MKKKQQQFWHKSINKIKIKTLQINLLLVINSACLSITLLIFFAFKIGHGCHLWQQAKKLNPLKCLNQTDWDHARTQSSRLWQIHDFTINRLRSSLLKTKQKKKRVAQLVLSAFRRRGTRQSKLLLWEPSGRLGVLSFNSSLTKNKNNRNVNKTGVGRGVKLTVLLRPTSFNAAQQQEQTKPPRSQTHDC